MFWKLSAHCPLVESLACSSSLCLEGKCVFFPWMALRVHRCLFLSSPVGSKNPVGELFWEAELCLFCWNLCCLWLLSVWSHKLFLQSSTFSSPGGGVWWVHPLGRWEMEPWVSPGWQSCEGISLAVCSGFVRLLSQKNGHYFLSLFKGELVLLSK